MQILFFMLIEPITLVGRIGQPHIRNEIIAHGWGPVVRCMDGLVQVVFHAHIPGESVQQFELVAQGKNVMPIILDSDRIFGFRVWTIAEGLVGIGQVDA